VTSDKTPGTGRSSSDAHRLLDLLNALGSTTFRRLLWQRAAELELTYAQSQVLFYVGHHPGCHMGNVAKGFGVTLAAITQIVDRLEQKKFLTRGMDPGDRRVYALELTAEGKALVEELETLQIQGLKAVLERMSDRDRNRVLKGLEALVKAAIEEQRVAGGSQESRRKSNSD
jgi:DNA-binding MarR family transcriptional regulator